MEAIHTLEKYSAPLLVALSIALLWWAVQTAGGFGPMLSTPSQFGPGMPKASSQPCRLTLSSHTRNT